MTKFLENILHQVHNKPQYIEVQQDFVWFTNINLIDGPNVQ